MIVELFLDTRDVLDRARDATSLRSAACASPLTGRAAAHLNADRDPAGDAKIRQPEVMWGNGGATCPTNPGEGRATRRTSKPGHFRAFR
jgi:hypothetical protein